MVHDEEAARAVGECLENPEKVGGEVFLVSDGVPMSRQEIADAAAEHEMFAGKGEAVTFTGGEEVDGKKQSEDQENARLGAKVSELRRFHENWIISHSFCREC